VFRSRRVQLRHHRFPYGQRATLTRADFAGADEDDPLAPEPANLTGALTGYARQIRALTEAACIRVFSDKLSGKTADRPSSPRAWTTCRQVTPRSCRAWTGCHGPCRT
jgi:hypothetical protein